MLYISRETVKSYMLYMYHKLDLRTSALLGYVVASLIIIDEAYLVSI